MKSLFLILITGLLILDSCTYDKHFPALSTTNSNLPPYVCSNTDSVHFATDLKPIIAASCALTGCHAGKGNNGALALDYTQISNLQLEDSAIFTRLTLNPAIIGTGGFMPKNASPLPDSIIKKFYCWWQQGAQDN
jgi:hypothetical protein